MTIDEHIEIGHPAWTLAMQRDARIIRSMLCRYVDAGELDFTLSADGMPVAVWRAVTVDEES